MNAGRLLNGKKYGRWVKVTVGACGELGVGVLSYVPIFKIASKILLGKIVCH